jgi:hypothetical protein
MLENTSVGGEIKKKGENYWKGNVYFQYWAGAF